MAKEKIYELRTVRKNIDGKPVDFSLGAESTDARKFLRRDQIWFCKKMKHKQRKFFL